MISLDNIVLNFNVHLWKIPPKLNKLKKVLKENLHKTIFLKKNKTITFTHSWTRGKMKTFRKNQWADFDQNQDVSEFSTQKSPKRSSLCIIKVVLFHFLVNACHHMNFQISPMNKFYEIFVFVFLDPTLPPCWFSFKVACVVNLKLVFTA